jgi:hypothetical protein
MSRMSETGTISTVRCPHCGALHAFPGFSCIEAFICQECGEGVDASPPVQRSYIFGPQLNRDIKNSGIFLIVFALFLWKINLSQ